ncbi:MAG: TerB family tellurite resistance protein [Bacteroidales bacterium]|jgi:DnaJ like chaperone protein|nr:TerB family tellurite resistance protein [Bacteroidales bacterium]
MAKYGKWLGAGLGWALGGPIGGILGFTIGSIFDGSQTSSMYGAARGNFAASLIVLIAAVMKADDKVMKSELDYVKAFFTRSFGHEKSAEALVMLRDILKKDIPLNDVCEQIQRNMPYSERLQLIHLLFGVANADGKIIKIEIDKIEHIARLLRIDEKDFISIKSMFVKDANTAYKILEISPDADDQEIKKAYRKMAIKYHPDKVAHLGEDFQKSAKEKFQKVSEAYETLKQQRNIA